MKRTLVPGAHAVVALACVGAYFGYYDSLPIGYRDRPWPLEMIAIAVAISAIALLVRWQTRSATAAAAIAVVAALVLPVHCALRFRLPAASSELRVGEIEPSFTLRDDANREVTLSSLRGRPVILVYYRGASCPFCRAELERLAHEAPPFIEQGVQILAVSDDSIESSAALKMRLRLPFPLLADPEETVMPRCRVSHCVVLLDGQGVVRWGALSEQWRDPIPFDRVLQFALRLSS